MKDLHILPRLDDSWTFLYTERCRVDQDDKSIAIHDETGSIAVPCAMISLLILGPGSTITHAAVKVLAESGCMIQWAGEEAVRLYAVGLGETRSSRNLLAQAKAWADPTLRLQVVREMYLMRFDEPLPEGLSLQEIRGREGVRVRETYARLSRETGVEWHGRSYDRRSWTTADPVNRALSCANSCLYGVCHAAIVSAGFSPAIGFVHTGKALSFVYDIADLYKTETSISVAFQVAAEDRCQIESRTRRACRDAFRETRLLQRIVGDLRRIFAAAEGKAVSDAGKYDSDEARPGPLWDPLTGQVEGGVSRSVELEGVEDGRHAPRKGPGVAQGRTDSVDDRAEGGSFRR